MAAVTPHHEPVQFVAGDTVIWSRAIPAYLATDGWTLKYAFRGVSRINVTAAPSGSGYLVTIDASLSDVTPGLYEWTGWVENSATPVERHTVASGRVVINPKLAGVIDTSRQQHAERMVALLEAQLEQLAASPIETYTIEQQTTVKRKMAELRAQRSIYKAELRRLRNRGRMGSYAVHFGRA